eukprot:7186820-Alexandrium_andersonii.AAC.1
MSASLVGSEMCIRDSPRAGRRSEARLAGDSGDARPTRPRLTCVGGRAGPLGPCPTPAKEI